MTFAEFCAWLWIDSGRNFWTKIAPGLAGLLTFALMRDSIAPARAILTGLSAVVATYVIIGLWYRRQIRFFWLAVAGTFILAMLLSLVAVTAYDLAADFVRSRHWGESVADRLERECKEIVARHIRRWPGTNTPSSCSSRAASPSGLECDDMTAAKLVARARWPARS